MGEFPRKSDGRRVVTVEFKRGVVQQLLKGEKTLAEVSRELDIGKSSRALRRRDGMSTNTILLVILILLLLGALPLWPYSGGWGYYPSGGAGLLLLILVILLLTGRL